MSANGRDNTSSNNDGAPSKPPRPPPPSSSKLPRPPSIQHHLEALQGLRVERVRWFVKEDKKWIPFNGCDSLAIENCYRQILALESRQEDSSKVLNTSSIYEVPTVKGGLYEVDVVARECFPIYWKDKHVPVCRGTWFTGSTPDTWQPVGEDDAEQIENSHQAMWRAMGLPVGQHENKNQPTERQGLGRLNLKGYYVEWNDIADVWLYWDDVKSRIIRNVGGKIGFPSGPATQLHRGYHTDACSDDKPPEITHLMFVVHGIGQLLHMSNIVKSSADLRQCASTVLEKRLSGIPGDQRVEFFPVEWRSSLKLDEGTIESITPTSVSGLRKVLNTSMMDIMYYTSPFYRYEIIDGLRDEMNRLHEKFCKRNPSFLERNGKVSVIAHSLGSVITYDILSLWDIELRHLTDEVTTGTGFLTESLQYLRSVTGRSTTNGQTDSENPLDKDKGKRKLNLRIELAKARSEVMKLEAMIKSEIEHEAHKVEGASNGCPFALQFKVENLFCVGSPLAVFLTLRGLRPQDDVEEHVLPKSVCKRVINIYHPADPVAYRLEPLISADYKSIPPVQLHRHDSSKTGYSDPQEFKQGGGRWKGMFSSYRVGFTRQHKSDEEGNEQCVSSSSDGDEVHEEEDEEMVIVHNAVTSETATVDGAQVESRTSSPSKKSSWIASLFGSSKPSTSSQDLDDTDSAAKDTQAKKAEHISVPEKVLSERLDYALREGYMESNYWSAVTSHVSYWTSYDVARFVLENCLDITPDTN